MVKPFYDIIIEWLQQYETNILFYLIEQTGHGFYVYVIKNKIIIYSISSTLVQILTEAKSERK